MNQSANSFFTSHEPNTSNVGLVRSELFNTQSMTHCKIIDEVDELTYVLEPALAPGIWQLKEQYQVQYTKIFMTLILFHMVAQNSGDLQVSDGCKTLLKP